MTPTEADREAAKTWAVAHVPECLRFTMAPENWAQAFLAGIQHGRERAASKCEAIAADIVKRAEADPLADQYDLTHLEAARNTAAELRDVANDIRKGD